MYLGIDLGTSSVKVILLDEGGTLVGEAAAPLTLSRPRPLWSEQDPQAWWNATLIAVAALRERHSVHGVSGIGLSGQMHGAVGGGARSKLWGRILAASLQRPLTYHHGGEVGPALGAARLARIAVSGASLDEACTSPPVSHVIDPKPELTEALAPRHELFRQLYSDLKLSFAVSLS